MRGKRLQGWGGGAAGGGFHPWRHLLEVFLLQFGVKKISNYKRSRMLKGLHLLFFPAPICRLLRHRAARVVWASLAPCFSCLRLYRRSPQEAEEGGGRGSLLRLRLRLRRSVIVCSPSFLPQAPDERPPPPPGFGTGERRGGRVDPPPLSALSPPLVA